MDKKDQLKRRSFLQIVAGALAVSSASFLGLVSSSQAYWQQEGTDDSDHSGGEEADASDQSGGEEAGDGDHSGDDEAGDDDHSGDDEAGDDDHSGDEETDSSGRNGRGLD